MAELVLHLPLPLPREEVWRRLWSPARHTAAVPLTTVTTDPPGRRLDDPGTRVLARTRVGPLVVDDTMTVVRVGTASPDWECHLVKTGSWVRGAVAATVHPDGAGGSVLRWRQRISVRGVPAALDPVVAGVAWVAYRAALRRVVDAGSP